MNYVGKLFLVTVLFLLLLSVPVAASDLVIDGLELEDVNAMFHSDGITFQTSYMDHELTPEQAFIPDEISEHATLSGYNYVDAPTGERVEWTGYEYATGWTHENDGVRDLLAWGSGGGADAGSQYPANFFQIGAYSSDLATDNDLQDVFDYSFVEDNNGYNVSWNINVSSHYEHLVIDYQLVFSNATTTDIVHTWRDVYSGDRDGRLPVAGQVQQLNTTHVQQTISYDNRYDPDRDKNVIVAHHPDTEIVDVDFNGVLHSTCAQGYDLVEPELDANNISDRFRITDTDSYTYSCFNVSYPADSHKDITVTFEQPEPLTFLDGRYGVFDNEYSYFSYLVGSVASFKVDSNTEWSNGQFSSTTTSSGDLVLQESHDGSATDTGSEYDYGSGSTANRISLSSHADRLEVSWHSVDDGDCEALQLRDGSTNDAGSASVLQSTSAGCSASATFNDVSSGDYWIYMKTTYNDDDHPRADPSSSGTISASGATWTEQWGYESSSSNRYYGRMQVDAYSMASSGSYTSETFQASEEKLWQNITVGGLNRPSGSTVDATVETSNDGFSTTEQTQTISNSELTDGTNTYQLDSLDVGATDLRFKLDLTKGSTPEVGSVTVEGETANSPATITLDNPKNQTYADTSIEVDIYTSDFDGDNFTCTVKRDGNQIGSLDQNANEYNHTETGLSDGQHNISVDCTDAPGASTISTAYFSVDTTPPNVSNTAANNTHVDLLQNTTVQFTAGLSDTVAGIGTQLLEVTRPDNTRQNYTLTGGDRNLPINWSSGHGEGDYIARWFVNDTVGNMNATEEVTIHTGRYNVTNQQVSLQNFTNESDRWHARNNGTQDIQGTLTYDFITQGTADFSRDNQSIHLGPYFSQYTVLNVQNSTGSNIPYSTKNDRVNYQTETLRHTENVTNTINTRFNMSFTKLVDGDDDVYLFESNATTDHEIYAKVDIPPGRQFDTTESHPRYWVCTDVSGTSCNAWTSSTDVKSDNRGDNTAGSYTPDLDVEEADGVANRYTFRVEYQSPFMIRTTIEDGGMSSATGTGGTGSSESGTPNEEDRDLGAELLPSTPYRVTPGMNVTETLTVRNYKNVENRVELTIDPRPADACQYVSIREVTKGRVDDAGRIAVNTSGGFSDSGLVRVPPASSGLTGSSSSIPVQVQIRMPDQTTFERVKNENGSLSCRLSATVDRGTVNDVVLEVEPKINPFAWLFDLIGQFTDAMLQTFSTTQQTCFGENNTALLTNETPECPETAQETRRMPNRAGAVLIITIFAIGIIGLLYRYR